jgi:hypothetical protein
MSNAFGTARVAFAAVLAMASSAAARADAEARTHVTIRGTGSNITIQETQAPARRPFFEKSSFPSGAIGEAVRLKTEGADDVRVIAYLRVHEGQLPPVIEAADVRQLRKAGAGKSVVAYLATVAAVDVGETGEGREPAVSNGLLPETEAGTPVYGMPYGYPVAGGYAAPYPARRGVRGFSQRRMPFSHGLPVLRGSFPRHTMPGHRRME